MLDALLFKNKQKKKFCLQSGATLLFGHVNSWHASFPLLQSLYFDMSMHPFV